VDVLFLQETQEQGFAEISVPPFSAFLRTVVCFALVFSEGGRYRSLSLCGSEQSMGFCWEAGVWARLPPSPPPATCAPAI
jgi:hypothetical protein